MNSNEDKATNAARRRRQQLRAVAVDGDEQSQIKNAESEMAFVRSLQGISALDYLTKYVRVLPMSRAHRCYSLAPCAISVTLTRPCLFMCVCLWI